ncbi:protein of unknown function (plasmid) [Paraburkholderia kururiensis]|uniref:hypothetical protein n=1 Tax=Paraburkholderia kururiensis TaxID=984307 RepID=UPI0039A72EF7
MMRFTRLLWLAVLLPLVVARSVYVGDELKAPDEAALAGAGARGGEGHPCGHWQRQDSDGSRVVVAAYLAEIPKFRDLEAWERMQHFAASEARSPIPPPEAWRRQMKAAGKIPDYYVEITLVINMKSFAI